MTCIRYYTYYDDHILECTGHTEYAKHGEDILCAAVTILCYCAKHYLEEAAENGLIANLGCDINSGYACIRFTCEHGSEAEKCFSAVTHGFRILAESFPNHIFYEE